MIYNKKIKVFQSFDVLFTAFEVYLTDIRTHLSE